MSEGLSKKDSMALKGMAVLMLVFHHCYRTTAKFEKYHVIFRGLSQEQVIAAAGWCKICVAIFAFVSGYGLMYGYTKKSEEKKKDSVWIPRWTIKHILSTMSGFWFTAIVFYLLYFFKNGDFHKWGATFGEKCFHIGLDILGISKLMGTKNLNGSWWYMSAALVYILLLPLLAGMIEKYGAFLSIAVVFIIPRVIGMQFPGGTAPYSFLMIFTIGAVCCRYDFFYRFRSLGHRKLAGILLGLMIVSSFFLYHRIDMKVFWEFHFAVVPFTVILFCTEYLYKIRWISDGLGYLGKHSMNIWLIHTFVRDWLGKYVFAVREFWLVPVLILLVSLFAGFCLDILKRVSGYEKMMGFFQEKFR